MAHKTVDPDIRNWLLRRWRADLRRVGLAKYCRPRLIMRPEKPKLDNKTRAAQRQMVKRVVDRLRARPPHGPTYLWKTCAAIWGVSEKALQHIVLMAERDAKKTPK